VAGLLPPAAARPRARLSGPRRHVRPGAVAIRAILGTPAGGAGRVAATFLGVVGLLGLGLTAAGTCLRWREPDL
jgi:hypothetical protein